MSDPKNTTTSITPADREKAVQENKKNNEARLALRDFLMLPENVSKFSSMLGDREARFYINSVIMQVAFKPELTTCTQESVVKAALQAASLQLSCDESLHQAQLVPYLNKKTNKKEAKFIPHYMGIVNLAQRTGKYRTINWGPITENMTITQDPLTGLHTITGRPDSSKVRGYFSYYEMNNGFRKSEYMTVEEIDAHAKRWAPSYNNEYSSWKDPKKLPFMQQKTVIRKNLKSADLSGKDFAALASVLGEDSDFDPSDFPSPEPSSPPPTKQPRPAPAPVPARQDVVDAIPAKDVERPLDPITLRAWLTSKRDETINVSSDQQRGFMAHLMTLAFAPDKDAEKMYHSCLHFLWGKSSSKELDGPALKVTLDWLNPTKDTGGAYSIDPMAAKELKSIWYEELKEKGQETLPGMEPPQ